MLSIVIPTFNEKENVIVISYRIGKALGARPYEIIFIDDSTDNTPEYLALLKAPDTHVSFVHRETGKGLADAVIHGFNIASGNIIVVMDADLQHPPELLPEIAHAVEFEADLVIPSRFLPGGSDDGLNIIRKTVSYTACYIGKALLKKLRPINDPTSGFFAFRRKVINNVQLNPVGWKILIEVLVKGNYMRVVEIPYKFQRRETGYSKMSIKEQFNYLRHIIRLLLNSPEDRRFYLFSLVGLSGVCINMFIFNLLIKINVHIYIAGICSAIIAMLSNFFLNRFLTWKDMKALNLLPEMAKYILTSLIGICINIILLGLLYYRLHMNHFYANIYGIAASIVWNYIVNNNWTWKKENNDTSISS